MGERYDDIDAKIRHYRWLAAWTTDKAVLDAIDRLIAELETTRHSLAPDDDR